MVQIKCSFELFLSVGPVSDCDGVKIITGCMRLPHVVSPQSSQVFGYDDDGRLTSTRDTVVNGSTAACTTRAYALGADSNRAGLASYPDDGSNTTSGHCSTSTTAVSTSSTFDAADRVTNTGYGYDSLGRTTTVPGVDAAGVGWAAANTGPMTVGYYANDLVASEVQGGPVMSWTLDPLQSRLATQVYNGVTTTNHYGEGSDSPSWVSTSASAWTRELTGPAGMLAGTQTQAGVITLQFVNLHGDVVATDADSASSTGIDSYSETTEYGAPRTPSTGYRPWGYLGGKQRSTAQLGGTIAMGVRLYDPATARFLSTDPIPGGNDNPYLYVTNPTDQEDLTGLCWGWGCSWAQRQARSLARATSSFSVGWSVCAEFIVGGCVGFSSGGGHGSFVYSWSGHDRAFYGLSTGPSLTYGSTRGTAYCFAANSVGGCHGSDGGRSYSVTPSYGISFGSTFARSRRFW